MAGNGNGESNGYTTGTGSEKINTEIVTLTRFLTEEQSKHKEATGDFTSVLPLPLLLHAVDLKHELT